MNAPISKEAEALGAFLAAMHDSKLSGSEMRKAMLAVLGIATPHTAPLSDAEIEEAIKAARHSSGTLTPTDLARAIERAVLGRGGEQ